MDIDAAITQAFTGRDVNAIQHLRQFVEKLITRMKKNVTEDGSLGTNITPAAQSEIHSY